MTQLSVGIFVLGLIILVFAFGILGSWVVSKFSKEKLGSFNKDSEID